ncbi:MAG: TerC family protein [Bacillota bacterium]
MSDLELLWALASIIIIDIVLGGDNAIVIAMASRKLPGPQRNRAIVFGAAGAILVRGMLAAFAVYLLMIPFLKLVGGLVLIWIAVRLLKNEEVTFEKVASGTTLLQAVKIIIVADVAMGLDNVLAVAGAADGHIPLIIIGLAISVPIIIWGSKLILKLMEKTPLVVYVGAGVLAWTAGKMIVEDPKLHHWVQGFALPLDILVPLAVVFIVPAAGHFMNRVSGGRGSSEDEGESSSKVHKPSMLRRRSSET